MMESPLRSNAHHSVANPILSIGLSVENDVTHTRTDIFILKMFYPYGRKYPRSK